MEVVCEVEKTGGKEQVDKYEGCQNEGEGREEVRKEEGSKKAMQKVRENGWMDGGREGGLVDDK